MNGVIGRRRLLRRLVGRWPWLGKVGDVFVLGVTTLLLLVSFAGLVTIGQTVHVMITSADDPPCPVGMSIDAAQDENCRHLVAGHLRSYTAGKGAQDWQLFDAAGEPVTEAASVHWLATRRHGFDNPDPVAAVTWRGEVLRFQELSAGPIPAPEQISDRLDGRTFHTDHSIGSVIFRSVAFVVLAGLSVFGLVAAINRMRRWGRPTDASPGTSLRSR